VASEYRMSEVISSFLLLPREATVVLSCVMQERLNNREPIHR
jgi:hypothetical protein